MTTTKQSTRKFNWMHILRNILYQTTDGMFVQQYTKQLETNVCVLGIMATNALQLKHQANRIHGSDQIAIALGQFQTKQGKSEGFDSCDWPGNLTQTGFKSSIVFSPCDLEIWWMTSKIYRAPLLHYIKLCAPSQTPQWIQTEVTDRKRSIWVKISDFLSHVTLKFDGWPWKTIWHFFYVASSSVHNFKAIGEFRLELLSGNAQFGSKSAIYCPVWLSNLMDDLGKQKGTSSMLLQALCITSKPSVNSN